MVVISFQVLGMFFCVLTLIFLAIKNDHLKRKQRILKKKNQELDAAMQAKSQFLANMSHEIRTPMNGVLGMTELLLATELDEDQEKYIGCIKDCGDSLMEMVTDILDFSKTNTNEVNIIKKNFKLAHGVRNSINMLQKVAEDKSLDLNLTLDPNLPEHVYSDEKRIRQVITNLVNNALKFTHKGGVDVHVALLQTADAEHECHQVSITVRDTGIGIAPEKYQEIFKPFTQVDESVSRHYGGVGLGLAICKSILEALQGTISVRSKQREGTEFKVILPMQPARALELRQAATESEFIDTSYTQNLKILVVEDDILNQQLLGEFLNLLRVDFKIVNNGLECLEVLKKEYYRVILMDCQMPVMDGYQASKLIHDVFKCKVKPKPHIVAMTAHALRGDREVCLEAGMDSYIAKPFTLQALKNAIQEAADGAVDEAPARRAA